MQIDVISHPHKNGIYAVRTKWTDESGKNHLLHFDFATLQAAHSAIRKARRYCPPGCRGIIGAIARMSDCPLDSETQMKLGYVDGIEPHEPGQVPQW